MEDNTLAIKQMPVAIDAEQAFLGAVIKKPDAFDTVGGMLTRDDFYLEEHKHIYDAVTKMYNESRTIDPVTLVNALVESGIRDQAGGIQYITLLASSVATVANIKDYARIIKDKSTLRRLITACDEISVEAYEGTSPVRAIIDSAEQKIFDIRRGKNIQGLQRLDEVLVQTFDRLDLLNRADESVRPVSTGIGDLDRVITGLNRSDLILLAARPGMGKTSFALNITKNVACTSKKTVAFFSLEMTKEQLASRLLSSEALVGGTKLRTGKLTDEEWQRLISAGDVLNKANIYLDDTPGITVPEMKAKLRRLKDVDLVVIDYLQLMSAGGRKTDNRVQEISDITRNLKILAKEINVPVICLSQLSRASEQRTDHKPQLSDLRDSGSIEQDADIVLFLYREGYYDKDKGENVATAVDQNSGECLVAKNRHGETSSVKLHWQGEFMRFTSVEAHREA